VFDRLLAAGFGAAATDHFARNEFGVFVGHMEGDIAATPLADIDGKRKELDLSLLKLADVFAQ
jgi:6-phosphofructokinase 1